METTTQLDAENKNAVALRFKLWQTRKTYKVYFRAIYADNTHFDFPLGENDMDLIKSLLFHGMSKREAYKRIKSK